MGLPEMKPRLSDSRTPFSTPGMYWPGTTPPTILSSKTNVSSEPIGSGSISNQTSPNCPCPPLCRLCRPLARAFLRMVRSEEHTSELQSQFHLVCRLLLEKKNDNNALINHLRDQY